MKSAGWVTPSGGSRFPGALGAARPLPKHVDCLADPTSPSVSGSLIGRKFLEAGSRLGFDENLGAWATLVGLLRGNGLALLSPWMKAEKETDDEAARDYICCHLAQRPLTTKESSLSIPADTQSLLVLPCSPWSSDVRHHPILRKGQCKSPNLTCPQQIHPSYIVLLILRLFYRKHRAIRSSPSVDHAPALPRAMPPATFSDPSLARVARLDRFSPPFQDLLTKTCKQPHINEA